MRAVWTRFWTREIIPRGRPQGSSPSFVLYNGGRLVTPGFGKAVPKTYKSVTTREELEGLLSVALANWPLYRELNYTNLPEQMFVPQLLELHCPTCKREQIWETPATNRGTHPNGDKRGFVQKSYTCRNCRVSWVTYYFYWKTDGNGQSTFLKVGQYPELEERISGYLEKALDEDDLTFYKKALRLRNFGVGIASLAYMRRVVENRLNDMLDILHESGKQHDAPAALLQELSGVKESRRFSDKVEYAAKLLPENLRPQGLPNPLGVLHELVSDGLHARSEDECTDIFDKCRFVFEYVFGKLKIEQEEARAFVKNLTELAKPRTVSSAKPG